MQIVSNGDNLHEMSNPIFREKQEKYFKLVSAENFTQSVKSYLSMKCKTRAPPSGALYAHGK